MAGSPTAGAAGLSAPTPAPSGRDQSAYSPVFVLSPTRSYSSVITTMIGRHPELYGFPELLLWTAPTVRELLADPARDGSPANAAFPDGLVRAIAEVHHGGQGPGQVAAARAWLLTRRSWSTSDLYDHLLSAVAPRRGVEKTPQTAISREALERVGRAYPRARFIHLTRHPATALASMHEHWLWGCREYGMTAAAPMTIGWQSVANAASWLVAHQNALEFGAGEAGGRVLRVRGEDVLANPEPELTRIARWLGVSDTAAAVEEMLHPERSAFAKRGPCGARYGNDPKFLDQPVPRPVPLPPGHRLPPSVRLPPALVPKVERLAARLGY